MLLYIVHCGPRGSKVWVQVHFVTDTLVPNGWSWMQPANGEKTETVFHLACASFSSSNCFGDRMSETCSEDIIGSHFCCFRGCERRMVSLASLLNKVRGEAIHYFVREPSWRNLGCWWSQISDHSNRVDQKICVVKEGDQVKDQDENDWRLSDEKEGRGGEGVKPTLKKGRKGLLA